MSTVLTPDRGNESMVFGEAFAEEGGLNRAGNEWGFDRLRKEN